MLRIVVVDDEIRTRRGIINLIAKIGKNYQVVGEAADGIEGYEIIMEQKPDLVITDIRMPNQDGLEMIGRLKTGGFKCKYIILSSYAEFDYAKKAVKLGIAEYLLKPITVNELVTCIQAVEKEIFDERLSSDFRALNSVSPEIILERLIVNSDNKAETYISELENHIGIGYGNYYGLVVIDFEKTDKDSEKKSFLDTLNDLVSKEGKAKIQHIVTHIDYKNQLIILFAEAEQGYSKTILNSLKNLFDNNWWLTSFVIGYMEMENLHSIAETYACLCESFQWRIVMKEWDIIDPVKLKSIKCSKFIYPMEIEERICNLIKVLDFDQILDNVELFFDKLNEEIYHPGDVKEGVIRFTNSILFLIRQVNVEIYDNIKQMEIIEWLRNCRLQDKMKNVVINLVNQIFIYSSKKQTVCYGLVVQKVISIIHEEYASDLSLYDIASRFNITPEYLSTIFAKETGKKFVTYITEYRIERSKELIKAKRYKIYEVAKMVGYPDVKYYCKIFKKVTGISTGDYQKING